MDALRAAMDSTCARGDDAAAIVVDPTLVTAIVLALTDGLRGNRAVGGSCWGVLEALERAYPSKIGPAVQTARAQVRADVLNSGKGGEEALARACVTEVLVQGKLAALAKALLGQPQVVGAYHGAALLRNKAEAAALVGLLCALDELSFVAPGAGAEAEPADMSWPSFAASPFEDARTKLSPEGLCDVMPRVEVDRLWLQRHLDLLDALAEQDEGVAGEGRPAQARALALEANMLLKQGPAGSQGGAERLGGELAGGGQELGRAEELAHAHDASSSPSPAGRSEEELRLLVEGLLFPPKPELAWEEGEDRVVPPGAEAGDGDLSAGALRPAEPLAPPTAVPPTAPAGGGLGNSFFSFKTASAGFSSLASGVSLGAGAVASAASTVAGGVVGGVTAAAAAAGSAAASLSTPTGGAPIIAGPGTPAAEKVESLSLKEEYVDESLLLDMADVLMGETQPTMAVARSPGGASRGSRSAIRLLVDAPPPPPAKATGGCAGCGLPFPLQAARDRGWLPRFSSSHVAPALCEYTGQWYCGSCHRGSTALVPHRVLHRWDFEPRAVSSAAHDFLESTFEHPMLCVSAVSPQLFKTVPALAEARELRVRLVSLHRSAAHCQRWQPLLQGTGTRRYLLEGSEFWAMRELVEISKGGELGKWLKVVLQKLQAHSASCPGCSARRAPGKRVEGVMGG
mmetsp:Transcript_14744/g.46951  ORF Transcript_14744/g.46951 Transcript_14744/m.46951 type:complete len:685 (+) Transcript_14744:62-2116(+)